MVGIIQLKDRSLKGRSVVWCKPPELRDVEDVDRSPPNAVSWIGFELSCQMDDELPRPLERDNDQSLTKTRESSSSKRCGASGSFRSSCFASSMMRRARRLSHLRIPLGYGSKWVSPTTQPPGGTQGSTQPRPHRIFPPSSGENIQ